VSHAADPDQRHNTLGVMGGQRVADAGAAGVADECGPVDVRLIQDRDHVLDIFVEPVRAESLGLVASAVPAVVKEHMTAIRQSIEVPRPRPHRAVPASSGMPEHGRACPLL
jgi:hypothetical protein